MSTTLPLQLDLVVYSGASYSGRPFVWKPDGTNPQDFTGWTGRARIGDPNAALIELTDADGGVQLSSTGQITLAMTPTQTAGLPVGPYAYQLDLIDPSGAVIRFSRGRLTVVLNVGPPAP